MGEACKQMWLNSVHQASFIFVLRHVFGQLGQIILEIEMGDERYSGGQILFDFFA